MSEYQNFLEARKIHDELNNNRTLGAEDNTRIELELKIMQHYFAFSNFALPFNEWLKEYLKDIFPVFVQKKELDETGVEFSD